jgi:hypothetical protein
MNRISWIAPAIVVPLLGWRLERAVLGQEQPRQRAGLRAGLRPPDTAHPGKFEVMKARFKQHVFSLFKNHHMELIGFWTYADAPASENTLVYILAHANRAALAARTRRSSRRHWPSSKIRESSTTTSGPAPLTSRSTAPETCTNSLKIPGSRRRGTKHPALISISSGACSWAILVRCCSGSPT